VVLQLSSNGINWRELSAVQLDSAKLVLELKR
jgi:hypothetical protein